MTKLIEFPNRDLAREQASLWLARIDRSLTPAEMVELEKWLATSASNRDALLELAQLWDQLDVLAELSELFPLAEHAETPRYRRWWLAAASATIVIAAVLIGIGINTQREPSIDLANEVVANTYRTGVGEQSSVVLPDESIVTLNTNTRIDVRYTSALRSVVLRRGEAHFVVTRDTARTFNVFAGSKVIQAVGTAFNVQLGLDDEVEVTVTEGVIAVGEGVEHRDAELEARVEPDSARVAAGEMALVRASESTVVRLGEVDIENRLAWQRGMIVFEGERLEAALAEVGRYTTVEFSFADPGIRDVLVGGYYPIGDVGGILHALRESFGIDAQRIEPDRVVLSMPPDIAPIGDP